MSPDDLQKNEPSEPVPVISAHEQEEIDLLEQMLALPDRRPDPGIYRNVDIEGETRDLVELAVMISLRDPRPFTTPWRAYFTADDLFEDPRATK